MRRINQSASRDQIAYHLGRNDAPEFDQGQPGRIDLARFFIEKMLLKDLPQRPLRIVELGCGAGDVTGPYAGTQSHGPQYKLPRGWIDCAGIEVVGIDVVPVAMKKCAVRWPDMTFILSSVEEVLPIECDLVVMTEFLEHVADPVRIVSDWLPHARMALIGHPLDEPDPGFEHGHSWSYTEDDWHKWFELGHHRPWEKVIFPMGHWDRMVMGHSSRL